MILLFDEVVNICQKWTEKNLPISILKKDFISDQERPLNLGLIERDDIFKYYCD